MPIYCGDMKSHNVRTSSGKRSRKAHQRSRCRKVSSKAQADAKCSWNKKRCVVRSSAVNRFNPYKYATQRGGAIKNPVEGVLKGIKGSLCNALPEKDCKRVSKKKNFPCRWVDPTIMRKGYCGIAVKAATQGKGWRQKAGRSQFW
jgi:hypothetical protein